MPAAPGIWAGPFDYAAFRWTPTSCAQNQLLWLCLGPPRPAQRAEACGVPSSRSATPQPHVHLRDPWQPGPELPCVPEVRGVCLAFAARPGERVLQWHKRHGAGGRTDLLGAMATKVDRQHDKIVLFPGVVNILAFEGATNGRDQARSKEHFLARSCSTTPTPALRTAVTFSCRWRKSLERPWWAAQL